MIMFKFNGVAGKPRFSIDVCALLLNNCMVWCTKKGVLRRGPFPGRDR